MPAYGALGEPVEIAVHQMNLVSVIIIPRLEVPHLDAARAADGHTLIEEDGEVPREVVMRRPVDQPEVVGDVEVDAVQRTARCDERAGFGARGGCADAKLERDRAAGEGDDVGVQRLVREVARLDRRAYGRGRYLGPRRSQQLQNQTEGTLTEERTEQELTTETTEATE